MPPTFDEIVGLYTTRKLEAGDLRNAMIEARDHFNGDIVIPMPEMDKNEKPAVANTMLLGLEQTAQRVASVLPNLIFPELIPGKETGRGSKDWARRRRLATASWWEQNKIGRKLRRMARWTIGYGFSAIYVQPWMERGIPRYSLRDPLNVYPNPTEDYDDELPPDCITTYWRTAKWLIARFPNYEARIRSAFDVRDDTMLQILEYVDAEIISWGIIGTKRAGETHVGGFGVTGFEIGRIPNRAERPLVVVGKRITFDKLMGQFNQLFGIYFNQAAMMSLELLAIKKGIFPDLVITGNRPGAIPSLVTSDNRWKDGRSGEVNIIKDGRVDVIQLNPGFLTQPTIDRQERYIRTQGNVPAQFGGESPSRIATGRLGNQVLSATVDFPIQEYQEILSLQLEEANRSGIAIAKGYFGAAPKSFYVNWPKATGPVDYEADKHFETDVHSVNYAAPGADVNSLVIGIGQRLGIGTMSAQTAMEQDPMVPDAEKELAQVRAEQVERSLLAVIAQRIEGGLIDPMDAAWMADQLEQGTSVARAFEGVQRRAQERQAELAAAQAAQPALPAGPEMQPGIQPPGTGPAEIAPAVGPPQPSQQNLAQLLGALRQPRSLVSPMAQPNAPNVPVGG